MISKTEATEKLKNAGYTAKLEDGIVQVTVLPEDFEKERKRIVKFLKEVDYRASWGIHGDRNVKDLTDMSDVTDKS